jgi:hypothetical protein
MTLIQSSMRFELYYDNGIFAGLRIPDHRPAARLALMLMLLLSSSAWAGSFRVHHSIHGSGRDITVQAQSSSEARRTVMDMFPRAVVTGVHRIK